MRAVEPKVRLRRNDRDPSASGLHQGAQHSRCRSDAFGAVFEPVADTPLTMAATDQTHPPNNALAPREPPTHGPRDNGEGQPDLLAVPARDLAGARAPSEVPGHDGDLPVVDAALPAACVLRERETVEIENAPHSLTVDRL